MHIILLLCVSLAVFAFFFLALPAMKRRRYAAILARPFPEEWERILVRQVSLYRRLPPGLKQSLHGLIHVLLEDKRFEGCDGLAVNEEMKLAIAAQACVPMLAKAPPLYPGLLSILLYPTAYVAKQARPVGGPAWLEEQTVRGGESWRGGEVVLAWEQVDQDCRMADGSNVVLHEFAHQLDHEGGAADGTPPLANRKQARAWREVFGRALVELRLAEQRGKETVVDSYGAENEAEFFACAVEAFFERPVELKREQPELYEQLEDYFLLDPADWG